MNDRYEVKIASAPGAATFAALDAILRTMPMDRKLHSVVPFTDRDGTLSFVIIAEPLK